MEALPAMGTLYAMYPVLVDTIVFGDVHPYFSSGWCSSEFYTAILSKKLDQFSSGAVEDFKSYLANSVPNSASGDTMISKSTIEALNAGVIEESHVEEFA